MRKFITWILVISLLLNMENIAIAKTTYNTFTNEDISLYEVKMKQDLLCLMIAYPEYITNIEEANDHVYLIMKSGKKLLYDDKARKNSNQKLANPDLQDTLEQIYPLSPTRSIMVEDFDPGRFRCYELLSQVYGSSKKEIETNLTNVRVGYINHQFNSSNNASTALETAFKEILPLSKKNQNVKRCVFPSSGTFNYRVISGTNRLSPHSFGIAIDLASDKRDYWKWASKEAGEKRLSTYPSELVEIFENNGFIWGGKWSHFDILHFEYRPEIILKARYFSGYVDLTKPWYEGAPLEKEIVKNSIEKINVLIK